MCVNNLLLCNRLPPRLPLKTMNVYYFTRFLSVEDLGMANSSGSDFRVSNYVAAVSEVSTSKLTHVAVGRRLQFLTAWFPP